MSVPARWLRLSRRPMKPAAASADRAGTAAGQGGAGSWQSATDLSGCIDRLYHMSGAVSPRRCPDTAVL